MHTNALPHFDDSDNTTGCCPRFNPEGWDGQDLHFREKTFVRATTTSGSTCRSTWARSSHGCTNIFIDHYRAKAKEVRNQSVEADDEDYFGEDRHWETSRAPRAWEKSPLESLEDRELQNYLYDCISRLPTTRKAAVVLRDLEQQATGEICKQLEVSATNLNVILYRARMHLRACLETAGFRGVARG